MLKDQTLGAFSDALASNDPVPGGGSVSALAGALAASLAEMVANLTIGKKKYAGAEAIMKEVSGEMLAARKEMLDLIDRDADAFDGVMAAFKLPKETEEEKAARSAAIQAATKEATEVPLGVAEAAFKLVPAIDRVIEQGNQNAITDGAVAMMMARTAVLGALYNVAINLDGLKDAEYVEAKRQRVKELREQVLRKESEILSKVSL